MIDPSTATVILCVLAFVLIVLLPVLDAVPVLTRFISFRWTCAAIILLLMVGVVLDFKELADTTRDIVITGGMIIVGGFILVKTIEKILSKGWLNNVSIRGKIEKGDWKGGIELSRNEDSREGDRKEG